MYGVHKYIGVSVDRSVGIRPVPKRMGMRCVVRGKSEMWAFGCEGREYEREAEAGHDLDKRHEMRDDAGLETENWFTRRESVRYDDRE